MALPILDGNQTAATLSTIITGGAHIPAHTVVSLGSQAISDITSGVSGSVVSISNFPSTQTIAGTVTANTNFESELGGSGQPNNGVQIAFYDSAGSEFKGVADSNPLPISGTVTANVPNAETFILPFGSGGFGDALESYDEGLPGVCVAVHVKDIEGNVFGNTAFPISGTVTANVLGYDPYNGVYPSLPITRADDGIAGADNVVKVAIATELGGVNDSAPLPISGTVTANNPNGALTTRFGSVATANLAFITSAVTNTSRKYLLAQNISAGTVTIGIGFSPTTTQGIQLTAGGGLTFDAFCPTGAVYWLGAVTGAAFTILEG